MPLQDIRLKRAYDSPADTDGLRILVERLWPRGLSKADAAIDHWTKDVAPSAQLRTWFGHRPERWVEFRRRYCAELTENVAPVEVLKTLCGDASVSFVFAAKDRERNSAVVLRDYLMQAFE